jgi:hypothetical protein
MAKVSPTISSKARQPEYLGSSPVSRKRRHEEVEDDEEVPVRRKTQVVRYIESEDEATTPLTSTNNSRAGSKQKRAGEKSQRQLINPPADLPLRAPARTPGIPSDALGMDEFFQKNTPCALGVQLPINAARTQWEWVAYVPRKARNARFDWADEENIRDANRWRQQRLRRRLAQHGLIDDGRKRRWGKDSLYRSGKAEEIRKTGYRMIYRKTERNAEKKAEWLKEVIGNRSRRKRRWGPGRMR